MELLYKYLITYYGEPIAITDSFKQAEVAIKQHTSIVKSDPNGYAVDGVRYMPGKEEKDGTQS